MRMGSTQKRFGDETVQALAHAAEVDLSEESRRIVASILEQQIGHLRTLPLYDLTEADPELTYDPRWES
jgi:Asp-tRNA(Asn)/Glu-tRNA(Gln) amidotransferase C subunit